MAPDYDDTISYAESTDGIHWDKPNLGIIDFEGSKKNNIVWAGPGNNMVPFKDPNPDVPDDERYKAFVRTEDILGLVSPDGLHWRLIREEPLLDDGPVRRQNKWDRMGAFKACNLDANRLRQFSDLPTSVRLDSFASPPVSSPVWRLGVPWYISAGVMFPKAS